jgi:uncharacterized protein (DUF1499 family)
MDKNQGMGLRVVLLISVIVCVTLAVALWQWPFVNAVETGKSPAYPDLQPRTYAGPAERVFEMARKAAGQLPRWKVLKYQFSPMEIRAVAKTPLWGFADEVTIHVDGAGEQATVHVRSASKVGRWDFGQNARNVRLYFDALDRAVRETSPAGSP